MVYLLVWWNHPGGCSSVEILNVQVKFISSNSDKTSHLPSLLLHHLAMVKVSQADIFSHAGCSRLRRVRGTGMRLAPPPRRKALLADGRPDRRSDKRGGGLRRWMGARGWNLSEVEKNKGRWRSPSPPPRLQLNIRLLMERRWNSLCRRTWLQRLKRHHCWFKTPFREWREL